MNHVEMEDHTLTAYDRKLDDLTQNILKMGEAVQELLKLADRALDERSEDLVQKARDLDTNINKLDETIEDQVTSILALQNPVANDLRFVTTALKIAVVLERAGDQAKNITKRSANLDGYHPDEVIDKLHQMVNIIATMLDGALKAISRRDAVLANQVWQQDDEVDALYYEVMEALQKDMAKQSDAISSATHLIFAAKNFERMADYATNIAKTVHYILTGEPMNKEKAKRNAASE